MKTSLASAAILISALFVIIPIHASANHKAEVSGTIIIDSNDPGIKGTDDGCDAIHYHGTLNGVADPDAHGCGHGLVTVIPHGDGDGEVIPPPLPKGPSFPVRVWRWLGSWFTDDQKEAAVNVVDVVAESNGIAPPGTVSDTVDIVVEATPSIMENTENIKEYRESIDPEEDTMGIHDNLDNVPENPTISQRFFRWFNHLVD
ncbi:MAG: hypothetical protein Q7S86_05730 [bacterium]|nr:hypothetical protein [bacterium]